MHKPALGGWRTAVPATMLVLAGGCVFAPRGVRIEPEREETSSIDRAAAQQNRADLEAKLAGITTARAWSRDWRWEGVNAATLRVATATEAPGRYEGAIIEEPYDLLRASKLSRTVRVPRDAPVLSLTVRSPQDCFLAVHVDGQRLWETTVHGDWHTHRLDLAPFAGQTAAIDIVHTGGGPGNMWQSESLWWDDVRVEASTGEAGPATPLREIPPRQRPHWFGAWQITNDAEAAANEGVFRVAPMVDGRESVLLTCPPSEAVPCSISRRCRIPEQQPRLRIVTRALRQCFLRVEVEPDEAYYGALTSRGWTTLLLDLSLWAGSERRITVEQYVGGDGKSGRAPATGIGSGRPWRRPTRGEQPGGDDRGTEGQPQRSANSRERPSQRLPSMARYVAGEGESVPGHAYWADLSVIDAADTEGGVALPLVVTHTPNPCDQYCQRPPVAASTPGRRGTAGYYEWFYRTDVRNNLPVPLHVVAADGCGRFGGPWVPATWMAYDLAGLTTRPTDASGFAKSYDGGTAVVDGTIPPNSTATNSRNWHHSTTRDAEPVKWAFTATDPAGNMYYADAVVQSVPIPAEAAVPRAPEQPLHRRLPRPRHPRLPRLRLHRYRPRLLPRPRLCTTTSATQPPTASPTPACGSAALNRPTRSP